MKRQSISPETRQRLLRACFRLWMITAWMGLAISILLFALAAAQLAFPGLALVPWESGDLLASLAFFALIGGLCVWLVIYGRALFQRLRERDDFLDKLGRD